MLSCIPNYLEKVLCKQGNVAWLVDDLQSVFENGNLMAGKIKCPFSFSKLNHALAVIQNLNLYYSHLAFLLFAVPHWSVASYSRSYSSCFLVNDAYVQTKNICFN